MRWCRDWAAAACPLVQPLSLCLVRLSAKSSIPRESLVSLILCQAQANTSSFTIFPGISPTANSRSQQSPACGRTRAPTSLKTKSSSSFYTCMRNDEGKWIISRSLDIMYCCQCRVWIYGEDPEPQCQSCSKANKCQWGPNVKQLLLCNTS